MKLYWDRRSRYGSCQKEGDTKDPLESTGHREPSSEYGTNMRYSEGHVRVPLKSLIQTSNGTLWSETKGGRLYPIVPSPEWNGDAQHMIPNPSLLRHETRDDSDVPLDRWVTGRDFRRHSDVYRNFMSSVWTNQNRSPVNLRWLLFLSSCLSGKIKFYWGRETQQAERFIVVCLTRRPWSTSFHRRSKLTGKVRVSLHQSRGTEYLPCYQYFIWFRLLCRYLFKKGICPNHGNIRLHGLV